MKDIEEDSKIDEIRLRAGRGDFVNLSAHGGGRFKISELADQCARDDAIARADADIEDLEAKIAAGHRRLANYRLAQPALLYGVKISEPPDQFGGYDAAAAIDATIVETLADAGERGTPTGVPATSEPPLARASDAFLYRDRPRNAMEWAALAQEPE
jgi:hypothetical protein